MSRKWEYARNEFEYNGKRYRVIVHDYWVIEGKPVDLVWSLERKDNTYHGWPRIKAERAPKAVCWMAKNFYDGFVAGCVFAGENPDREMVEVPA